MLSVTLTLTNRDKAAKLLALLEELPFVEIQERQEIHPLGRADLLEIFNRYLDHQQLGYTSKIWTGPISIDVFGGIDSAAEHRFGKDTLQKLYLELATDHGLFESQVIVSGERKAYCVYRKGFRVLYDINPETGTFRVFHISKATASQD